MSNRILKVLAYGAVFTIGGLIVSYFNIFSPYSYVTGTYDKLTGNLVYPQCEFEGKELSKLKARATEMGFSVVHVDCYLFYTRGMDSYYDIVKEELLKTHGDNWREELYQKRNNDDMPSTTFRTVDRKLVLESNLYPSKGKIIDLPVFGSFDLSSISSDSTHEYGAGDCWGKVEQLSYEHVAFGIDSMFCGEYGFTFTHFLLTKSGTLQAVHILNCEWITKSEGGSHDYILTERVFDFNTVPQELYERVDTVGNLEITEINAEFKKDTLLDAQTTYEHWELQYEGIWTLELDY
ncbi:MAG: hypothetical protein JKX76_03430 [Colwellia sp.]|nr:hypothetical protein [Colwellia sp.]